MSELIGVEVVYALPDMQRIESLEVPVGTSAFEAVNLSGIDQYFEDLELSDAIKLGVFGKPVALDYVLRAGERVEIYRPLVIDPKEVRKQRAAKAKSERSNPQPKG